MASQTPWSLPERRTLTRRVGVGAAAPGRPVCAPGAAPGKGHARVLPEAGASRGPGTAARLGEAGRRAAGRGQGRRGRAGPQQHGPPRRAGRWAPGWAGLRPPLGASPRGTRSGARLQPGRPGASGFANARPVSGDPAAGPGGAAAPRLRAMGAPGAAGSGSAGLRPGAGRALCVLPAEPGLCGEDRLVVLSHRLRRSSRGVLRLAPEETPPGGRVSARAAGLCASPGPSGASPLGPERGSRSPAGPPRSRHPAGRDGGPGRRGSGLQSATRPGFGLKVHPG